MSDAQIYTATLAGAWPELARRFSALMDVFPYQDFMGVVWDDSIPGVEGLLQVVPRAGAADLMQHMATLDIGAEAQAAIASFAEQVRGPAPEHEVWIFSIVNSTARLESVNFVRAAERQRAQS